MKASEIAIDLETRAKAAGMKIDEACRKARFHPSTFYRWKKDQTWPNTKLVNQLEAVISAATPPATG